MPKCHDLVVSAKPECIMQSICEIIACVGWHITFATDLKEVHVSQPLYDLAGCEAVFEFLFQESVNYECQKASREMCNNPVITA